jgi:hypothetical protein
MSIPATPITNDLRPATLRPATLRPATLRLNHFPGSNCVQGRNNADHQIVGE